LKKPTGSVRFYKLETEKTKPKPKKSEKNRAKPEKTDPNRKKKPSQTGLNQFLSKKTKPNWNWSVWTALGFFFIKNFCLIIFFDKNRIEQKMITPSSCPGPRPRFWVLTGSPESTFFFKKNQNDVILVKKKSTGCNWVFDWVLSGQPGHTGFFLPLFFLQLGPVPAPGRPVKSDQVLKLYFKVNSCQFSWPVTQIYSRVFKNYDKWTWKHGD